MNDLYDLKRVRRSRRAFTLVEIMIIGALLGLLAVLAVPGFIKARKKSMGVRILNDARAIDSAINEWSLEAGKKDGDPIIANQVASYLRTPWHDNDILGNPYVFGGVGITQIMISATTKSALDGVGIDWGSY